VLTFYEPHWTGLTAIAKRIAEGLAERGHEVTVLTTQFDPALARRETSAGVTVVRLPTIGRFSRGMVAPLLAPTAARLIPRHDVVHIHTPLPEALVVALLARARRRPLLMTHQGDLVMPARTPDQLIERVGNAVLAGAGRLATVVSPLNDDYARHSTFLRRFRGKLCPILPPVDIAPARSDEAARWRTELGLDGSSVVGFAGRFVEEKGFDILFRALPILRAAVPDIHLVYAGEHRIAYEDFYERCRSLLGPDRDRVTFLGLVRDRDRLAQFYAMCDAFVLPSRSDSFAAVQVEALLSGTPVVATDIPGAREVVRRTGMGTLVAPEDPRALAEGIVDVLARRADLVRSRDEIERIFDAGRSIDEYEALLERLATGARVRR